MPEVIPDNLALEWQIPVATSPTAQSDTRVPAIELGLAIGFGTVFLFGVTAWVLELFDLEPGFAFAHILLISQAVSVCGLVLFVLFRERMPLASLGIRKPDRLDLEMGLGLFVLLLILEVAVGSLVPFLDASEAGFLSHGLWLPLPKLLGTVTQLRFLAGSALIITMVVGDELAVRGYAFTRLEQLTHRTLLAAGLALLVDLVAHAPLWGIDYTIAIVPAQLILMWFYVSERRLLPCLVGHLAFELLPALLSALNVPLLPGPAPAMNAHTQRGFELMRDHQYLQAIAEFSQALRESTRDEAAYRGRGESYALHGDFDNAIKDFNDLVRIDADRAGDYAYRSFSYQLKGDLPHALADIDSAIRLEPNDPSFLQRRGYIYSLMGDYDKAISDYSAAIALVPTDPDAYQARAEQYKHKGDYKKAIQDADVLVRLKPDIYSHALRGSIEVAAHDYDKALADARKVLALEPFNTQNVYAIARIYKSMGHYDDELSSCEKVAVALPKEAHAHACVADGYYHRGELSKAIAAMSRAIQAEPKEESFYLQRARLEHAAGLGSQARADIEKNATLQPNDAQVNNYAARLLSNTLQDEFSDPKAAMAFATKACKLTSWKNPYMLDTLAEAHADNGDFFEAVKWEQYALEVASSRPEPAPKEMRERLALYQNHTAHRKTAK